MLVSAFSKLRTPLASGYSLTSNNDTKSETSTVIKWLMSEFWCQPTPLLYLEYCPEPLCWVSLACSPQSLERSTRRGTSRHPIPKPSGKTLAPAVWSTWKRADKQSEQTQNHNSAIPTTPHHTCCLKGFIRKRERKEVGGGQEGREDGRKDPTDRGHGE